MKIPLVDLSWQHEQIAGEVEKGWLRVLEATSFIHGPEVAEFEAGFAHFCGVSHCIGVASGTDALELGLRAVGVGPGDEVIVPANSFIASALAVIRAGAAVRLVDCDLDTYLIDIEAVADAIGPKVKAVMPVHLFGQMAPVERLTEVVGDAVIIEDGAQSQGASRNGAPAGSVGTVAATSFYPGKNIGAYGDAGAVLTDAPDLADLVRNLGNWGSPTKYHHPVAGFNSRLDTLQAVVLSAKLARLADWNELRAQAAQRYDVLLEGLPEVVRPRVLEGNEHVWHLYVVRVPHRDRVVAEMQETGIGVGVHYPIPMHLQGALADLGHRPGDFPRAEQAAAEMLSLPMFPGITEDQQVLVVDTLRGALARAKA